MHLLSLTLSLDLKSRNSSTLLSPHHVHIEQIYTAQYAAYQEHQRTRRLSAGRVVQNVQDIAVFHTSNLEKSVQRQYNSKNKQWDLFCDHMNFSAG